MKKTTWLAIGRLSSSLAQVAVSEWRAVRRDMRRSARLSGGALLALVVGGGLLVVALVGVLFALGQLLSRWIPEWAGLLSVSGVFGLAAALLIWRARTMLRDAETPGAVVKRRWRDHRGWMRRQLSGGDAEERDAAGGPE